MAAVEVAALADLGNFSTRPVGLREGRKVFPDRGDRVMSPFHAVEFAWECVHFGGPLAHGVHGLCDQT